MRRPFLLRCDGSNPKHTRFTMFDQGRANCGTITILTADVLDFIANDWNGDVDWQGHAPEPKKSEREG